MSFGEEFSSLDPGRLERAHANVTDDLLLFAGREHDLTPEKMTEIFERITAASPGFLAIVGRQEEVFEMIESIPGMEYSTERYRMIQMTLGFWGTGLILTEYCRLESEES